MYNLDCILLDNKGNGYILYSYSCKISRKLPNISTQIKQLPDIVANSGALTWAVGETIHTWNRVKGVQGQVLIKSCIHRQMLETWSQSGIMWYTIKFEIGCSQNRRNKQLKVMFFCTPFDFP